MSSSEGNDERSFEIVLLLDVIRSLGRADESKHPADQRALIRTIVSAIEAQIWSYKEHVCETALELGELDALEQEVLSGRALYVDGRGKVIEQQRFLSLTAMLRLVSRIAEKVEENNKIDFGVEGWDALKATIKLRNRITHPKSNVDLEVRADDVDIAFAALKWVLNATLSSREAVNAVFARYQKNLRILLDAMKRGDERALELYRHARSDDLD